MKKRQDNIVFYAVLSVISLFIEFGIIPHYIKHKANALIGPELFPQLVTAILIVLSLMGLYAEYRAMKAEGGSFEGFTISFKSYLPHVLFLVSGVVFLIAAPILGFLIAAVPFLLFLLFLFGSQRKLFNLFLSIVYPVALFLIFSQVLRISFTAGIFGI